MSDLPVIIRFGDDRRVLIWDLYNEPGNSGHGEKSLPLAATAFRWAREAKPDQPLTIGAWANFDGRMSKALMEMSEVVSFHGYAGPAGVVAKSQICRAYNRPVLCTEWLHRQSDCQSDHSEKPIGNPSYVFSTTKTRRGELKIGADA